MDLMLNFLYSFFSGPSVVKVTHEATVSSPNVWLMSKHTQTWPKLAIGLYEALTDKKAEITYHFEDMKVEIPSGTGPEAQHALWKLDGKLRISTKPTE